MKDLTALYEHLQSAMDEAMNQECWGLASEIGRIQNIIEDVRAETTEQKQPSLKD